LSRTWLWRETSRVHEQSRESLSRNKLGIDDTFIFKADSRGRAMWLISSNYSNTTFYESHGYFEVGRIILGDDNPLWKEPPVVMLVVCSQVLAEVELSYLACR